MSLESMSGDGRTRRVMLARAVWDERAWRMNGMAMKRTDFVAVTWPVLALLQHLI